MTTPFDHIPYCIRSADYTKPTATASRAAQMEAYIDTLQDGDDVSETLLSLAAEVDARDEVITKLLAQFGEITCDPSCGITWTCTRCQAYARACEIAGRTE